MTARQLEAFVRLAEASARVRLSDTVDIEDAVQSGPFRMPVQWVNRPDLDFRGCEYLLGECLRAFDSGCCPARAEDGDSRAPELVRHAGHERSQWAPNRVDEPKPSTAAMRPSRGGPPTTRHTG